MSPVQDWFWQSVEGRFGLGTCWHAVLELLLDLMSLFENGEITLKNVEIEIGSYLEPFMDPHPSAHLDH